MAKYPAAISSRIQRRFFLCPLNSHSLTLSFFFLPKNLHNSQKSCTFAAMFSFDQYISFLSGAAMRRDNRANALIISGMGGR